MKALSRIFSQIFHPLLMPTLGLLFIFNSGTYLSLLDPAAKKAILSVMAMGTLVFPLMLLPLLHYRRLISSYQDRSREGRIIMHAIMLILYVITFIYFVRLPLNRMIHAYVLAVTILLALTLLSDLKFRICVHAAALGGLTGLILMLMLYFETALEAYLVIVLLMAGLSGSARIYAGHQRPGEVYMGFLGGMAVVALTLLLY
jgi:hypothetical protein